MCLKTLEALEYSGLQERHPTVILSLEKSLPVPLTGAFVATICNHKQTSKIIRILSEKFPLKTLSHLRRIKKDVTEDGRPELTVLISGSDNGTEVEEKIRLLLKEDNMDTSISNFRKVLVSATPPLTRIQFELIKDVWPTHFLEDINTKPSISVRAPVVYYRTYQTTFLGRDWSLIISSKHFDHSGETRELAKFYFSGEDIVMLEGHMRSALAFARDAHSSNHWPTGCVIIDPISNQIVSKGCDSPAHPLKHAVMGALDSLAESHCTNSAEAYIATGLDVYVTREPCVMCAMALLHSRVRRVFFGLRTANGGFSSRLRLHQQPKLNHRFSVYEKLLYNDCFRYHEGSK
ncbi:probable inactive tRNA-specific adenosine deaminase-like protein 3 isoform X1 [Zophobas morio]|uniref:probable inactive tRNA-specific adenosine deaminase-like protein 3 isoform X1 n=1 Tax=Zophobas morio TaxID=2755281 RepID=UPI003082868B